MGPVEELPFPIPQWWWWQNHRPIWGPHPPSNPEPFEAGYEWRLKAGGPHHLLSRGVEPWEDAVSSLVEAATVKQIAAALPEGELRSELDQAATRAIDDTVDEFCGTRPHPFRAGPWPWAGAGERANPWAIDPGPHPWGLAIASGLAATANTYQAGYLRDELLRIAGQVVQKTTGERKSP